MLLDRQRLFLGLWGLLCLSAWLVLWLGHEQGWGHQLHAGDWTRLRLGILCGPPADTGWAAALGLFLGGWLLMSAAMMLPTVLPLIHRFQHMVAARDDGGRLMTLLVAGYLLVWLAFGVVAYLLNLAVVAAVGSVDWLVVNGWVVAAVVIALAGLFQFSRLKDHCLERCRAPLGFVLRRWHGPRPAQAALRIGLDHGLFCVGCCWALMMLMFVSGAASLAWMLVLGAVMAAEKNMPGGDRLARPIGVALLLLAGWQAV